MKRYGLAVLALAGAPTVASAQLVCTANITPVTFDTITGAASAGTYDARGTITVTCTGSQGTDVAACVDFGQGAVNTSGQRLLSGPKANSMPIQIFQDATLSRPWGAAAMGHAPMLQRTGDGPMSATVYARLYVQRGGAAPGTYTAQFPVTLRYGAVIGGFANCNALGTVAGGPQKSAVPTIPRKR
jgi:spore coat protein U-like protein